MAASSPSPALAALLLAVLPATSDAQSSRATLPISVEADSSDFDYRNGVLVFRRIRVTQGDASVAADLATATGLEFQNSEWQFDGSVRIVAEGGTLESDTAVVRFRDNEIAFAQVTGDPATFSQQRGEQRAEGRAARIEYQLTTGRIRLTGGAWLSDGRNEITGSTLVYSMSEERIVAEAAEQGGEPVRITINPQSPPGEPPPAEAPPEP
jgi:lipopolysaccharide transport protein LptA